MFRKIIHKRHFVIHRERENFFVLNSSDRIHCQREKIIKGKGKYQALLTVSKYGQTLRFKTVFFVMKYLHNSVVTGVLIRYAVQLKKYQ